MFAAVDKNGEEWIYEKMPIKCISSGSWVWRSEIDCINVPKGTIQRLLNYPLTWDDDCQEIVEYKNNTTLNDDKVIKQNIKMRVTPEQSKKVQEICFANGVYWNSLPEKWDIRHTTSKFLYIEDVITHSFSESPYSDDVFKEENDFFNEQELKEIDADLFIRTNGTCEEESTLNDDDITRILKASEDQPIEYLRQKIINLHDQLNKYRKNIQNQKEELTRLLNQKKQLNNRLDIYALCNDNQKIKITNLLAQKEDLQNQLNMANRTVKELIDNEEYFKLEVKVFKLKKQLEKHAIKIGNQKEEITRLLLQKERLQHMLMMPCKSVDNNNLVKLLEEKDGIIKYLENKLEI